MLGFKALTFCPTHLVLDEGFRRCSYAVAGSSPICTHQTPRPELDAAKVPEYQ
jgi:hypothetical protein